MPHTHGVIAVGDLQGASVTVTITDERAEQPTVYTDESGESAADNPATVTEATRFHVGRPGSYTVVLAIGSVPVGGGTVYLDGSEASFAPAVSAVELAQYLGGGSGLPVPGSGDAGKVVTVTGGEDGFELDAPTGGASEPIVITDTNDVRTAVSGNTYVYNCPVNGNALTVNDGGITTGSPTLTSDTGGFSALDVGMVIDDVSGGYALIPPGTVVAAIVDDNRLTMSANATGTQAADSMSIGAGPALLVPVTVGSVFHTVVLQNTVSPTAATTPAGGSGPSGNTQSLTFAQTVWGADPDFGVAP